MLWEMYYRLVMASQLVRNTRGTLEAIRVAVNAGTGLVQVVVDGTERDLEDLGGLLDDGGRPFMLAIVREP